MRFISEMHMQTLHSCPNMAELDMLIRGLSFKISFLIILWNQGVFIVQGVLMLPFC